MNFEDIIIKNRSYRRFYENERIASSTLLKLIEYARLSASSGNIQNIKFFLSNDTARNNLIFPNLKWASYLKDWAGPTEGERPSAYIIILTDTEIHSTIEIDVGISAQSILLGAASLGYGGCMIGSVNRNNLAKSLNIPQKFQIPLVIALGLPKEKVVIDEAANGKIEYWRDEEGIHHVPKRNLKELIVDF